MVRCGKVGGGFDFAQRERIRFGIGCLRWRWASLAGLVETEKVTDAKAKGLNKTIEVAGARILDQVKLLIKEGNMRQLRLRAKDSVLVTRTFEGPYSQVR